MHHHHLDRRMDPPGHMDVDDTAPSDSHRQAVAVVHVWSRRTHTWARMPTAIVRIIALLSGG